MTTDMMTRSGPSLLFYTAIMSMTVVLFTRIITLITSASLSASTMQSGMIQILLGTMMSWLLAAIITTMTETTNSCYNGIILQSMMEWNALLSFNDRNIGIVFIFIIGTMICLQQRSNNTALLRIVLAAAANDDAAAGEAVGSPPPPAVVVQNRVDVDADADVPTAAGAGVNAVVVPEEEENNENDDDVDDNNTVAPVVLSGVRTFYFTTDGGAVEVLQPTAVGATPIITRSWTLRGDSYELRTTNPAANDR